MIFIICVCEPEVQSSSVRIRSVGSCGAEGGNMFTQLRFSQPIVVINQIRLNRAYAKRLNAPDPRKRGTRINQAVDCLSFRFTVGI